MADGSAYHGDRDEYVASLKRRYDTLKGATERANFETQWQEIGEVIAPRKVDFVGFRTPGEKKMNRVYDSTGVHALELLGAGLHGMATNPSSRWFSLRLVTQKLRYDNGETVDLGEAKPVQQYLADVEEIMWSRVYQPGTNFTTALHEVYLDLAAFGTAILFLGQRDDGGLLFEARPLSECVIAENTDGRVDTVFRRTTYTVRQMMQMAASDGWKLSDKVKEAYSLEKFDDTVTVIHAVFPRAERDPSKKNRENMAFASCYFEHEACHLLSENGFPEFPYLVSRWSKYSGEVYGRSPGMTALPDVKMLQAMELTKIKLLQKNADPPMWLKDDGVVGGTRTIPGGINYWRGNPSDGVMLQPVNMQGLQFLIQDMEAMRARILRTFYADIVRQFGAVDKQMTAFEVAQRTAEAMRLLGPLIGRLESELLGPMIERVFGILSRLKLLPSPPEEIQGQDFTVEYVSPIATAQKQQAMAGVMQAVQVVGVLGPELGGQALAKRIDVDKLIAWAWDLFNNDPDLLRDDQSMEQADQMQQMQMGTQMASPMVGMAATGAKAVKDIAQGEAATGGGISQLMALLQERVAADPKAQSELKRLMDGAVPAG